MDQDLRTRVAMLEVLIVNIYDTLAKEPKQNFDWTRERLKEEIQAYMEASRNGRPV